MKREKPQNIVFDVDEKPPRMFCLLQGAQHSSIFAISLVFPALLAKLMNADLETSAFMICMSMIAGGVGTILQSLKKGPVGSGYLCPQVAGPSFFAASMLAVKTGGLSLLLGMTLAAGVVEICFSRVLKYLRFLFPAEITGVIVAMVGITIIQPAVANFLGLDDRSDITLSIKDISVSTLTLLTIVGINVWAKGKISFFSVLIGIMVGYIASFSLNLIPLETFTEIHESPYIWFPFTRHPGWTFDIHLLLPFAIAVICSSFKSIGDISTCQKINDKNWKRPDMGNISKGILADGLGCFSAGLLGGYGQSTSSSNIGLSIAAGVTSRVIALAIGGILILLGFFPKFAMFFAIMPRPVMGAVLIFALSFMIIAGFQIIMSRMLDARKTFIVGCSIIIGIGVDVLPEFFHSIQHPLLSPVFSSSLSAAAVTAILLNLLLRIGLSRKASLTIDLNEEITSSQFFDFMEHQGSAWGARHDVIYKATSALNEFIEVLEVKKYAESPVNIEAAFDELILSLNITYEGQLLKITPKGTVPPDLTADSTELACALVAKYTDSITCSKHNSKCHIHMNFEH